MTAVIGIINKSAAAIAADSAVTITGPRGPKIYNRSNKIFRLSNKHPVGLMIYNQGQFMGTPWETIIKLYRKIQGEVDLPKLEDYKDNFLEFLKNSHLNFYGGEQQEKKFLAVFTQQVVNSVVNTVISEFQANPPGDFQTEFPKRIELSINNQLALKTDENGISPEFKDFTMEEFEKKGFVGISSAFQQVTQRIGLPMPKELIPKMKELVFKIIREGSTFNFYTGLVFTGFGVKDLYPAICAIQVSIVINNRLRYFDDKRGTVRISDGLESAIRPFAQKDVIDTVLAGADPGLLNLFYKQFKTFITQNNSEIASLVDKVDPSLAKKIREINLAPVANKLNMLISQQIKTTYINPMMGAVGTLSKEDLAEMAESLIYLTYLKRRFSFSEESVGGPVDVAIITKCDGFVWIKRKHYFPIELNQHFLKNYH